MPTASGFSRHRSVDELEIGETYAQLVSALNSAETGAAVVLHSCAAGVPIALLHGAGISGLSLDVDQLTSADWDALGIAMEQGLWLGAGALPTNRSLSADEVSERVLRGVRALGLDPEVSSQMLVMPACGLAGPARPSAIRALRTIRVAAEIVTEKLAD